LPKRCVFRDSLKESKKSPGRQSQGGRSFHNRGPAAEKLLSPNLLCVRGTSSFRMSLDDDDQHQTEDDSRHSKIRRSSTSKRLMDDPRDLKCESLTNWQPVQLPQHGVMWSLRRAPVTRRAQHLISCHKTATAESLCAVGDKRDLPLLGVCSIEAAVSNLRYIRLFQFLLGNSLSVFRQKSFSFPQASDQKSIFRTLHI